MPNELTVYDRVSDPVVYAEKMGRAFALSGMFSLPNEEAGMVVAMTCLCEQITPIQYLRRYHTIQGKPSMRADAMLAEFRMQGGKHTVIETSPEKADIGLEDKDGKVLTMSLTWEQAKQEPWPWADKEKAKMKDNWSTPVGRQDMLWARCVSRAVRKLCPEIVAGVYTPEEIMDVEPVVEPRTSIGAAKAVNAPTAGEVIDASYEVVKEPPAEKERPRDQLLFAIEQLFSDIKPNEKERQEAIDKALFKRGVKTLNELSEDQAKEMFDKLRAAVTEAKNQ